MGKSTISMVIFNSKLFVYYRVLINFAAFSTGAWNILERLATVDSEAAKVRQGLSGNSYKPLNIYIYIL